MATSAALAFRQVSAGEKHTCGLTTDDRAYCWGLNEHGQLGDGSKLSRSRPTPVARGLLFSQISAGSRHTCGVTLDGQAYCWGLDDNGQLGINSLTDRVRPVLVQGVALGVRRSGRVPYLWDHDGRQGLLLGQRRPR